MLINIRFPNLLIFVQGRRIYSTLVEDLQDLIGNKWYGYPIIEGKYLVLNIFECWKLNINIILYIGPLKIIIFATIEDIEKW